MREAWTICSLSWIPTVPSAPPPFLITRLMRRLIPSAYRFAMTTTHRSRTSYGLALTDVYEAPISTHHMDLNSTVPLTVAENEFRRHHRRRIQRHRSGCQCDPDLPPWLVAGDSTTPCSLSSMPTVPYAPRLHSITKPMRRLIPSAYRCGMNTVPRSRTLSQLPLTDVYEAPVNSAHL